jgi:hypothetical protein
MAILHQIPQLEANRFKRPMLALGLTAQLLAHLFGKKT